MMRDPGTSIDRAGGLLRLRLLAERLVGAPWSLAVIERSVDGKGRLELAVIERPGGRVIESLRFVVPSTSAAVRVDQEDDLDNDRIALEPLLAAEVDRLWRNLPPTVQRSMDGDR